MYKNSKKTVRPKNSTKPDKELKVQLTRNISS